VTDDRIWEQASIGERVDFLKVRLDRMDRAFNADRQKIEALFKANEVVVGRNCDLARRVAEIEKASDAMTGHDAAYYRRIRDMYEGTLSRRLAEMGFTQPAEVMVTKADLARLRRIEEAALRIIPLIDAMTLKSENDFDMAQALLDALKR